MSADLGKARLRSHGKTRIKICGITREQDLLAAVEAGVDAIGLVCFEASKRYVSPARAAQLRAQVPPFVAVVALFVNARPEVVRTVLDQVRPDLLQFHGDESAEACQQYHHPYLRALRVGAPGLDTPKRVARACEQYASATGWLFDSYTPAYGGSGLAFDHALLAHVPTKRPHILAGGLTPANVAASVCKLRPWAVDVSSGVESAPGVKSTERLRAFVAAVRAGECIRDNTDCSGR